MSHSNDPPEDLTLAPPQRLEVSVLGPSPVEPLSATSSPKAFSFKTEIGCRELSADAHGDTSSYRLLVEHSHDTMSPPAPSRRFLEAILSNLSHPNIRRRYRIATIDQDLLQLLRNVHQRLKGECFDDGESKREETDVEGNVVTDSISKKGPVPADVATKDKGNTYSSTAHTECRQYAHLKATSFTLPQSSLAKLYELVIRHCETLDTEQWKGPRYNTRFLADGGWPVYIVKLHQLIACCMTCEDQLPDNVSRTYVGRQSNLFEARSLWAAAVQAVTPPHSSTVSHERIDHVSANHHATTTAQPDTPSATIENNNSENATETKELKDIVDKAPTKLYVALIDGIGDYQAIGETPLEQAYMPALLQAPRVATTGERESLVFVARKAQHALICLDCDMLSFAIHASGRYDSYFWAIFLETMLPALKDIGWRPVIPFVFQKTTEEVASQAVCQMIRQRACHGLRVMRACLKGERLGAERCEYLSHVLLASNTAALKETFQDLTTEVWHSAFNRHDLYHLKRLEGILVALLGHAERHVRGRATVLLNMFYDQHDWQSQVPFIPVIKEVGDAFEIYFVMDDTADPSKEETPEGVFLILSAPSFNTTVPYNVYSYHAVNWKFAESWQNRHSATSGERVSNKQGPSSKSLHSRRFKWIGQLCFGQFPRCGFYDWRVVRLNEELGSWETVEAVFSDLRHATSSNYLLDLKISLTPHEREPSTGLDKPTAAVGKVHPHPERMAELIRQLLSPYGEPASLETRFGEEYQTFPLQGRFIVQPRNMADEQLHEIFVDHHGIKLDAETGRVRQRGSFASVTASLEALRATGITTIYLMGALARDSGKQIYEDHGGARYERENTSPFAVTCRATTNTMCGGAAGLFNLLKEARRVGIKVICDAHTRIAASRHHRKYDPHLLYALDDNGRKCILYGSSGCGATFEDTCQLNYRKVECWDLMVKDMQYMAAVFQLHGFHLENCQLWPPIFTADHEELQRRDPDGVAHYTVNEQLLGHVVYPSTETESGFWSTREARYWANPFLVKLCKELWKDYPELMFIGECFAEARHHDDRQGTLARSGVIPQLQGISIPLARMFGHEVSLNEAGGTKERKGGSLSSSTVKEIMDWFDKSHSGLPEGAIVVQSSCSHSSPLPGLLYGRGAWPAVDLLFLLPDVPSTFATEIEGGCFRLDIPNVFITGAYSKEFTETLAATDSRTQHSAAPAVLRETQGRAKHQHVPAVRGIASLEPLSALSQLEEEHIQRVGPEFGFDLRQIAGHYCHRRRLRHRFKIFRNGILVPLQAMQNGTWDSKILTFLRFDLETAEFVLVGINFSDAAAPDVQVSLRPLAYQFREKRMESDTVFLRANLFLSNERNPTSDTGDGGQEKHPPPLLGPSCALSEMFDFVSNVDEVFSISELIYQPHQLNLHAYASVCLGFKPLNMTDLSPRLFNKLYSSSLSRLESIVRSAMIHATVTNAPLPYNLNRILESNFVIETLISSVVEPGVDRFASALLHLHKALQMQHRPATSHSQVLHGIIVDSWLFASSESRTFDSRQWRSLCSREGGGANVILASTNEKVAMGERLMAKFLALAQKGIQAPSGSAAELVADIARQAIDANHLGSIVFIAAELGKWSAVGGLGVMVDELSCTLAQSLGQSVCVITPYYNEDRQGNLKVIPSEEVQYKQNINVTIGGETVTLGVHEGHVNGVHLIFLHNARFFPHPYPEWNVPDALRFLALLAKGSLEVLCQKHLLPQLIVTNDWPTGLVGAYGKNPHFFGDAFAQTTFFHMIHNLDANYEGRIYAHRNNNYGWITELNTELLVDPTWSEFLFNPSRCALLTCDAWGTVSPSYRDEIRRPGGSALAPLLNRYPTPFAYPNGVPLRARLQRLERLPYQTHREAKAALQQKYFGFHVPEDTYPLFAFIGRVTEQKGVHLIIDAAEQLIHRYQSRIQILVGGKVSWNDPYSAYCGSKMEYLKKKYPSSFWADPNEFFVDGPLVNLGADVGLMPSKFEPGGIVQHEFFIAGTPVLAFETGGLRDTVFEFDHETLMGNGFTFEAYQLGDFLYAMERAYRVVKDPSKYDKLRENARYSVVSCEQVAQAWFMEFCRLRRKLPTCHGRVQSMAHQFALVWDIGHWLAQVDTSLIDVDDTPCPDGTAACATFTPILRFPRTHTSTSQLKPRLARLDEETLVPFKLRYTPRGTHQPRSVAVSGSFDNWEVRHPMVWEHGLQTFTLNLALRHGTYFYKLIVDGNWEVNPDDRVLTQNGITNNVFVVE